MTASWALEFQCLSIASIAALGCKRCGKDYVRRVYLQPARSVHFRTNDLVWIDRTAGRPWLISPELPHEFVQALSSSQSEAAQPAVQADDLLHEPTTES